MMNCCHIHYPELLLSIFISVIIDFAGIKRGLVLIDTFSYYSSFRIHHS